MIFYEAECNVGYCSFTLEKLLGMKICARKVVVAGGPGRFDDIFISKFESD